MKIAQKQVSIFQCAHFLNFVFCNIYNIFVGMLPQKITYFFRLLKRKSLFLVVFIVLPYRLQAQASFSLAQTVQYALNNNNLIKNAQLLQKASKKNKDLQTSRLYPAIQAQSEYRYRTQIPPYFNNNNNSFLAQPQAFSASLLLEQPLFASENIAQVRIANATWEREILASLQTKIDVVVAVKLAFYDFLFTQSRRKVVEADVARLEKSLSDIQARLRTGLALPVDADRIQMLLNTATTQVRQLERAILYHKERLLFLINDQEGENIEFIGNLEDFLPSTRIETWINTRIEVQIARQNVTIQERFLWASKMNYLPFFYFSAQYLQELAGKKFNTLSEYQTASSYIALGLRFPLFAGMGNLHRLRLEKLIL